MANSLASRASVDRTLSLWRLSSSFLRSFSSAASDSSSSSSSVSPSQNPSVSPKKPKRKKKKNLFEVAQFLPNWGIGYHMAKTHWTSVSYEITKINLYKDGRHGKAWGIVYKKGLKAEDAPRKISGVHKRCWRYIAGLSKSAGITPAVPKLTENAPKEEPQTA